MAGKLDPNSLEYRMKRGEECLQESRRAKSWIYPIGSGSYASEERKRQLRKSIGITKEKMARQDEYLALLNRIKNRTQTPEDERDFAMSWYQEYTHCCQSNSKYP